MASLLYRLGRWAFVHRRLVVSAWIAAVIAVAVISTAVSRPFDSTFSVPGTSAQKATALLQKSEPTADGGSGSVVISTGRPGGLRTAQARTAIQRSLSAAARSAGVVGASNPFTTNEVSRNGQIARVSVQFRAASSAITGAQRSGLQQSFAPTRQAGLHTDYGGDAAAPTSSGGSTEFVGILIAFVVLVLTFGSLVAAGLPLITGILGVALALLGIGVVNAITPLQDTIQVLAIMLGLAVGIDYALFIVSRHRSQLALGLDPQESAARAVATAGSAIVFAGATVAVVLAGLAVAGIPFLTAMGLAGAGAVLVDVLLALTLIPAIVGFARVRSPRGKVIDTRPSALRPTLGRRWVGFTTGHRRLVSVVLIAGLAACASPILGMRLGLPDDGTAPAHDTARQAYDLTTKGFGAGANGPLSVVLRLPARNPGAAAAQVAGHIRGLPDIDAVAAPQLIPGGSLATITVTPRSGPTAAATEALVKRIRADAGSLHAQTGAETYVTGITATNLDIVQKVGGALVPYLIVVILFALVLLTIAFRSLLIPLTAVSGFLLTLGAALGAEVAVFQHGFAAKLLGVPRAGPIISFLPIIVIGILFGLSMDYQMFLVSRMREEHANGATPAEAIINGFSYGARVVTAAGLIMAGVFACFIIPAGPTTKALGLALSVGILVDAFLVRMTLIPALMAILGHRAWTLPRWLDRIIFALDLEGGRLNPDTPTPPEISA